MKTFKIIFSPTGGTEKIADILTDTFTGQTETIDLSNRHFDGSALRLQPSDLAVIAMPCFGGRIPKVAKDRLLQMDGNGCKAVVVNVYGNRAYDDALLEEVNAAKEAGFEVISAIAAVAEHSIMHEYAAGRPDAQDVDQLIDFASRIAFQLAGETPFAEPLVPGNEPYCKEGAVPLTPQIKGNCIKCGTCAESCPVGAIEPVKFKANPKDCIACMRCIKVCPVRVRKVNGMLVKVASMAIKKQESTRKQNELYL